MSRMETAAMSPTTVLLEQQKKKRKKKIFLAAVDDSKESIHALSWFVNNTLPPASSDQPLTLVLLYVKPPAPLYFTPDGYMFSPEVLATVKQYKNDVAECVMEKAKRVCKEAVSDKVKVETMIERGDARDVICEVAGKLCVDLLVMGSHGYGPIKRAFLGSVSNHCAQNVKCPILIIKRPKIGSTSVADAPSSSLMTQDPM
ncbi:Universal stress protein A-like protein [Linum grandiflorum]